MFNPLNLISKFIKSSNQKELDRVSKIVDEINSLEEKFINLDNIYFMEYSINKKDPLGIYPFIRTVNDFPIKGIKFRDITSLIENPKAFVKTCEALTRITREYSANFIVSIESRGFIFSGAVACNLYLPFVLARKPGKLPNDTFKKNYDLEYGSTSIEIQKNTQIK